MKIFKYSLKLDDWDKTERVPMPQRAKIISAQSQQGVATIWAEVHPNNPVKTRLIRWVLTGEEADDVTGTFIGTVQLGNFVVHLYDQGEA